MTPLSVKGSDRIAVEGRPLPFVCRWFYCQIRRTIGGLAFIFILFLWISMKDDKPQVQNSDFPQPNSTSPKSLSKTVVTDIANYTPPLSSESGRWVEQVFFAYTVVEHHDRRFYANNVGMDLDITEQCITSINDGVVKVWCSNDTAIAVPNNTIGYELPQEFSPPHRQENTGSFRWRAPKARLDGTSKAGSTSPRRVVIEGNKNVQVWEEEEGPQQRGDWKPLGDPLTSQTPPFNTYQTTIKSGPDFGHSFALSGDILAVGVPYMNFSTSLGESYSGVVRVWRWKDQAWKAQGEEIRPRPGQGRASLNGFSIALSGDGKRLVVSGSEMVPSASDPNSTRLVGRDVLKVFEWRQQSWLRLGGTILTEHIFPPPLVRMSRDGSTIATRVGAVNTFGTFTTRKPAPQGVGVFRWDARREGWVQLGSLIRGINNGFASSFDVSADGNTLAVTAQALRWGTPKQGAVDTTHGYIEVYSYNESTNEWERRGGRLGEPTGLELASHGASAEPNIPMSCYNYGSISLAPSGNRVAARTPVCPLHLLRIYDWEAGAP